MKHERVFARIKHKAEDFIVEEIGDGWTCSVSSEFKPIAPDLKGLDLKNQKDFLWCEMEKRDISHFLAVRELASKIGKRISSIGYAGVKDKRAWTSQRISIFNPDIEKIRNFQHPAIFIKNFKWAKRKIKMGYLEGNHFKVVLRDVGKKDAMKVAGLIRKTKAFPNYFGHQRFGVEKNNDEIGRLILKRDFGRAVRMILPNLREGEKRNPLDILKGMDRKNTLMFVNSVQSRVFNEILERAVKEGIDFSKEGRQRCILPGYKTRFSVGRLGEIERAVLEKYSLKLEDFDIKEIPHLRVKGSLRKAFVEVKNLSVSVENDDEFRGSKKMTLCFSLPKGVYATTFLKNFFDFETV